MKILFVSTKSPLPTNDGHALRTYNLLREVAARHEVYLLSFVKFKEEHEHLQELQKLCASVRCIDLPENNSRFSLTLSLLKNHFSSRPFVADKYDTTAMRAEITRIIKTQGIDLVHLDMLPLCCYLDCLKGTPVVLNEHNVESALLDRRLTTESNPLFRYYLGVQQKRLEAFETESVNNVDHVVCCSEPDRELLMEMAPSTPVAVVPNGVDTEYFQPLENSKEMCMSLVFVGGMNWFPNRDAVQWFDKEVFPEILATIPTVRLQIIGKSTESANWQYGQSIEVTGFVDDIRPHLSEAAVFVVPLRIGGGTRLKILDAMAMGKAIVSTSIGAEGLDVMPGRDLLIADTTQDFARAVLDLLVNRDKRFELGSAARELVKNRYQWENIALLLDKAYTQAAEGRKE